MVFLKKGKKDNTLRRKSFGSVAALSRKVKKKQQQQRKREIDSFLLVLPLREKRLPPVPLSRPDDPKEPYDLL